jgi:AcrR family transcriptional regulator
MTEHRPPRRTQGERSEETQLKILQAALECLDTRGFSETSTLRIQKRAGVSRGRLLHQFPSKEVLLVGAVQHLAVERMEELRRQTLDATVTGTARVRGSIELVWATYDGPLFWAAMELWLASRTSSSLRAALLPEERRLGAVIREVFDELFGEELCRQPGYVGLRETIITSMRGVALTYAFDQRDMATDSHVDVWYQMAIDRLGLKPDPERNPVTLDAS